MEALQSYLTNRLMNPWLGAAAAGGIAWYIAKNMPDKVQMLPAKLREPQTLALTAAAAVLAIHMFYLRSQIGSPITAVTEIVAPPPSEPASFPPRGLLGAEKFYGARRSRF